MAVPSLSLCGGTIDLSPIPLLSSRLPYEQPEVTREAVERVLKALIREAKVKVTRREAAGRYDGCIEFLALV